MESRCSIKTVSHQHAPIVVDQILEEPISENQVDSCMVDESSNTSQIIGDRHEVSEINQSIELDQSLWAAPLKANSFVNPELGKDIDVESMLIKQES